MEDSDFNDLLSLIPPTNPVLEDTKSWIDDLFQMPGETHEDTKEAYELQQMIERQQEYEESLVGYSEDSPYQKFKHNFMRPGYLPVKVVHHEKIDLEGKDLFKHVAERVMNEAYVVNDRGIGTMDQWLFCKIWYECCRYIYCGFIMTPHGAIEEIKFKSQIANVLGMTGINRKSIDSMTAHLYQAYLLIYYTDAYKETRKIPFRNGDLYLDKDEKGFTFHENELSPVPYRFEYDFKNIPNCLEPDFPNFKKWRDDLFDEEDVFTLKQMLGYLLIPNNDAQEAFFIIGKAKTGKSILTDCILPSMLGEALFPISIGSFFNDKFQVGTSEGKLCMVDDDIGETKLSQGDSGRFKNFVAALTIKIEHKHCNPVKITNGARIVCAGNHMINSDDKSDGFTRRLHPIYVKPRDIDNVDRRLRRKIQGEIEQIVLWALEGLLEVLNNCGEIYTSDRTSMRFNSYSEVQKWEEQFIRDCFMYQEDTVTYSTDVKSVLNEWLKENGELSGEGTLHYKYTQVSKWLKEEGADKFGFVYKRGIKRGDNYNARGFINMTPSKPIKDPIAFYDEKGRLKIRAGKKYTKDPEKDENGIDKPNK